jgi:hypothetical protein
MSKQVQNEKIQTSLEKIGKTLSQQRTVILKIEIPEFVETLNLFSDIQFSAEIIENMETGEEVSILYWFSVWLYFQNLDKIVQSYDAKEMMFLAQQEFLPNIEEEILSFHNKNK